MKEFKISKDQLPDDFTLYFCKAEVLGSGDFYNRDITLYIHPLPEDLFSKLTDELTVETRTAGRGKFLWFNLENTESFNLKDVHVMRTENLSSKER